MICNLYTLPASILYILSLPGSIFVCISVPYKHLLRQIRSWLWNEVLLFSSDLTERQLSLQHWLRRLVALGAHWNKKDLKQHLRLCWLLYDSYDSTYPHARPILHTGFTPLHLSESRPCITCTLFTTSIIASFARIVEWHRTLHARS